MAGIHLEQDFEIVAVAIVAVSEIVVATVAVDAETDARVVDGLIGAKVDAVVGVGHEEVDAVTDAAVDAVVGAVDAT